MNIYKGLSASSGTGIGDACIIRQTEIVIPCTTVLPQDKEAGWKRFEQAQAKAIADLEEAIRSEEKEQQEIFQTHILMLSDPEFISLVKKEYEAASYCIEYILNVQVEDFASKLAMAGDAFLTERANDILDAYNRVLAILTDTASIIESVPPHAVLVADSLKPSDALKLAKKDVAGIVTQKGGYGCHLAILARAYGIPFVSGIENPTALFTDGETVIVDGKDGSVISQADDATLSRYTTAYEQEKALKARREAFADKACITADGTVLKLYANISSPDEADLAVKEGADGIGLFRTEFLLMNSTDFSEEAQFAAYRQVLTAMNGKPVTIRTLDVGGDKVINRDGLDTGKEENPLLGWRAVRFCLDNRPVFKTQLRALYRASTYGNLRIMIPMISCLSEVVEVKKLVNEVIEELTNEQSVVNKDVPVGIMVETPAAALCADTLAKECGFFSIGTNDLTQYTLCVDRENQQVARLFNEFHPAVLTLISQTERAARENQIPLSVCGELAGSQNGAVMLAGLGVTSLSVSVSRITELKELFSHLSLAGMQEAAQKARTMADAGSAAQIITDYIRTNNEER